MPAASGIQYQRVKLGIGADGVATDLQPATVYVLASGTADVAAVSGARTLYGFSIQETAAAVATLYLRDGTTASDPIVATLKLAASTSSTFWFGPNGIKIATGIFVDRVTGTTEGALYYV